MGNTNNNSTDSVQLTLDDIADARSYERERDSFRQQVIEHKAKRRVHVGTFHSFVFEDAKTIRFQIQEMARAEKIMTDEGIQTELDIYNPLISRPGKLSATFFIELTSDSALREWLPKLTGVERAYQLHIGMGDDLTIIDCIVDAGHDETLTRDEVTACVHYLWWPVTPDLVDRFVAGPTKLVCTHPNYREQAELSPVNRENLAKHLR